MEHKPGDKIRLKKDECLGRAAGKRGEIVRRVRPSEVTIVDYTAGSRYVYLVWVPSYGEIYVLDGLIEQ